MFLHGFMPCQSSSAAVSQSIQIVRLFFFLIFDENSFEIANEIYSINL